MGRIAAATAESLRYGISGIWESATRVFITQSDETTKEHTKDVSLKIMRMVFVMSVVFSETAFITTALFIKICLLERSPI